MLKKIFSKLPSKGDKGSKPSKKKKGKKGKNSVVAEDSYLAKLDLEEQTVDSAVDELTELLQEYDETPGRNGALVELDSEYILAIALDEATLGGIYDDEDEAFGTFVNDVQEDVLPNLRLGSVLEQGLLVILPTHDAIQTLAEYDFVHDIAFQWVAIPSEISDDTGVVLCGNTVTYDELVHIDEDQAELTYYDDADGVTVSYNDAVFDDDEDADFAPDDEDYEDYPEDYEDEAYDDYDDAAINEDFGEVDSGMEEATDYEDVETPDDYNDITPDDYEDYPEDDYDEDYLDPQEVIRQMPDDSLTNGLNGIESYKYNNDEYDIEMDDSVFNRHFSIRNFELPLFDEAVYDPNSELEVTLAQQRRDMNREIIRIHENNIVNLRNEWITNSSKIHDALVARYNIDDESTRYGQAMKELRDRYSELKEGIYVKTQEEMQKLDEEYEYNRKQAGERAYREATERFDLDNKLNLDADKRRLRDELESMYEKDLANSERELRDRRHAEFRREYDKCQTEIFLKLQQYYKQLVKREFANIDHFRLQLDKMAKDHYADEVARAKALQRNDDYKKSLEQMKERFDEMNKAKETELREQMAKYERMDAEWNKRFNEMLAKTKQEYDEDVKMLQRKNERLQQSLVDIESRKDSESEKRIHTLENLIATQNVQLEQLQNAKQKGGFLPILAAVGVFVALIFGAGGGFLMANSHKQVVQQPVQQQPTVYAPYYGDLHKENTEKDSEKTTESIKQNEKTTSSMESKEKAAATTTSSQANTQNAAPGSLAK